MSMLDVLGGRLHYEVAGVGQPVVFVHGLALDLRMWDPQLPAVAEIATAIRYDVRGFGRSLRDGHTPYTHSADLWHLVDHVGFDRVVLVGLSMGGGIVLEAALQSPTRVDALVLLDAVLDGVPWDDESAKGMRAIGEQLRLDGLTAAKAAWLRHGFFVPARRSPDLTAQLTQMVDDYSGQVWTGHDPHGPHLDVPRLLDTITAPTTVVVGELDVPCFREMADVLAAGIPGADKIVVPDAGHMVNMEAPDTVNEILQRVIASADADRRAR
jgi:pimeloyl-ACP methyl ester carboxylesterase